MLKKNHQIDDLTCKCVRGLWGWAWGGGGGVGSQHQLLFISQENTRPLSASESSLDSTGHLSVE